MTINSNEFQILAKGKLRGKLKTKAPKTNQPKLKAHQKPAPKQRNEGYMYGGPVTGL